MSSSKPHDVTDVTKVHADDARVQQERGTGDAGFEKNLPEIASVWNLKFTEHT